LNARVAPQVRKEERLLKPQRRLDESGDRRRLVLVIRFVVGSSVVVDTDSRKWLRVALGFSFRVPHPRRYRQRHLGGPEPERYWHPLS
jgi:hypothetical protein